MLLSVILYLNPTGVFLSFLFLWLGKCDFYFFSQTEEGIVVVKAHAKMLICICCSNPVSAISLT